MRSEWMTFRQPRIVENVCWIAAHPQPFHNGSRTSVRHRRVRYDFSKRDSPKPVAKCQMRRLGRITPAPMLEGQTPTDLDTGREMGAEARDLQSGETDKRCHTRDFDGP